MSKLKKAGILLGDVASLYGALFAAVWLRYFSSGEFGESFFNHLLPFSLIFLMWLVVFYLNDLYQPKTLKNNFFHFKKIVTAVLISAVASVVLFYLFASFFKLTPKTNLLIFAAIFTVIDYLWRQVAVKTLGQEGLRSKLALLGNSPIISEVATYAANNPLVGFSIISWRKNTDEQTAAELKKLAENKIIEAVAVDADIFQKDFFLKTAGELLHRETNVIKTTDLFETVFQKIPLDEISERWFVENLPPINRFYETAKTVFDFMLAAVLAILFSPLALIVAILIKTTSKGSIIYKQTRAGKGGKPFTLYKFRTMRIDADGPLWTAENDERLTFVGKIARFTHLDEVPQLINILKGDISFIGPRPERWELAEKYRSLPHYDMRHLIKPGLTGWAQINYRPSASLEEAFEKLKYDIYYIKNRSLFLDLLIILKTAKYFFASKH